MGSMAEQGMEALPEVDPDLVVLQRIERGESTTQDALYVAEKFDELRKLKQEAQQ